MIYNTYYKRFNFGGLIMSNQSKSDFTFKKIPIPIFGIVIMLIFMCGLLLFNTLNNNQAMNSMLAGVQFKGEYRIGDGDWHDIDTNQHIPSTQGDVTLRGDFHLYTPNHEYVGVLEEPLPIALYTDHINITIVKGKDKYMIDNENPLYAPSSCGIVWTAYTFEYDETKPIEMVIHNPHRFGNENAIDELISHFEIWRNIEFEKNKLDEGAFQRNIGLLFLIVSFILLGIALFSSLLHIKKSHIIWLLGFTILFAGVYIVYSAYGISIWNDSVIMNTTILGIAMMFYMFCILSVIISYLRTTKQIGNLTIIAMSAVNGICFGLPMISKLLFYDTWLIWVIAQTIANIVMMGCLIKEYRNDVAHYRVMYIGFAALLIAFEIDFIATYIGLWKGGLISSYIFIVLFAIVLIYVLKIVPSSIISASKAKELDLQRRRLETEKNMMEVELKESRIALMLSQIKPHFIYNTLGAIERMCLKNPQKAFELVRNFSLYLRGNFSQLDSVVPISFLEEMKHVEYYVKIEKVRFPDINVEYQLECTDFVIPPLSVQPLVENAIKHGLMRLETGGTVIVHSYETSTHFVVDVSDNGVGFDVNSVIADKKHVGLRNIRERLAVMLNGELKVQSSLNGGTKAIITIPREVNV